jgi:ParB-like chromosome segregation protein Spo0J
MVLRLVSAGALREAPYNPRVALVPGSAGWRRLERSLREFSLVQPIVWNERTGHVVSGHQRLAILKHQGMSEVEVAVVDLPLEREKALNVALNNSQVGSEWDPAKLVELLGELSTLPEFDATLTGFDERDLRDMLLEKAEAVLEEEPEEDGLVRVVLEVERGRWREVRRVVDGIMEGGGVRVHVE